ncbi:MAG: transcriptional regulator [Bifidobacterium tibiigranuli]|jgi:DNA-binding transcriptional ArsR family regulator|uniref:winged helix-turn-helix domain-containing protein n=1 Tax=Bifidobacterium tibiigranuli TaxID=2172043 RepID=UPI0026EEFC3D|nr:transcriptional regulator [Bifidobacterium tibiigranuli]MCI1673556.1 transcriptional regulator [Bifidobacterium tibiigranuli]MCI1713849.1 transcriptional regulator [Bifidobacterium tibiigranuli]
MEDELDPVIHAASRLRIMTALAAIGRDSSLSFAKLADLLDMTPGNLSVHLTKLEKAGYVAIEKTFEGRKPATFVAMSEQGRDAFDHYLAALKKLLGPVDKS